MFQKTAVRQKTKSVRTPDTENNKGYSGRTLPAVAPAQLAAEEELPMQGKFETMQKAAEEELPMQGKFETMQKVEEEEALQGKFETMQKAGEEELPMQGKFDPVQKMEEEEALQGKFETMQKAGEEELPMQGKFDPIQKMEEEEALQGKFETMQKAEEEELPMQGKFDPAGRNAIQKKNSSGKPFQLKDDAPTGGGQAGLPASLKTGIESLSGFSMDDVNVHYNSSKPKQFKAHAYAQGTDIHIGPGQEQHLPHEAWHIAQQKQGRVQPTLQMKEGVPVNDDAGLEKEADVMGAKAVAQGKGMKL